MKQIQCTCLLFAAAILLSGCSSMQGGLVSSEAKLRNKIRAQKAWNEWSWCYDELEHPYHFAKGFKAGYRDILDGGKGCQPTLPDKCYYKSKYRTAEGRVKVNAWFDGFLHGVLAAQQDGAGSWNQIPISPTARMNMQAASAQPHPMPGDGPGLPPPVASMTPPEVPVPLIEPDDQEEPDPPIDLQLDDAEVNVTLPLPYE